MNNIPNLIKLKEALFRYAERSSDFLDEITSDSVTYWKPISMQIDDDVSVSISSDGVVTAVNTTTNDTVERIASEMIEDFTANASDSIAVSVSTMAQAQCDAMNTYTALAAVTELFMTRATISANDVRSTVIDSVTEITPDITRILSCVQHIAGPNGNISSTAWISMVNSIFKDSADSAQQGFILDKSKPFVLRSILQVAVDFIADILPSLMTAIAAAINYLAGMVASALSTIFSALRNAASQAIEVNDDSNTDYVKGPISFGEKIPTLGSYALASLDSDTAVYFRCPVGDFYCWVDGSVQYENEYPTISLQGYLRPTFSIERVAAYVAADSHLDAVNYWITRTSDDYPTKYKMDYLYLTDEEALAVNSDPALVTKTLVVDQLFRDYLSIKAGSHFRNYTANSRIRKNSALPHTRVMNAFEFAYRSRNMSLLDAWLGDSVDQLEVIQRLYADMWSVVASTPFTNTTMPLNHIISLDNPDFPDLVGTFFDNPYHGSFISVNSDGGRGYASTMRTFTYSDITFIPNEPRYIIPDWSNAVILRAMGVVMASVAAVFAMRTVAAKLLAKRSASRQLTEVAKLNALKRQYDANPTRENSDALFVATKKYNRKARLRGWGQYDSANAWLNAPSVPTNDTPVSAAISSLALDSSLTSGDIIEAIGDVSEGESITSVLKDLSDASTTTDTSVNDLNKSINLVYVAITGSLPEPPSEPEDPEVPDIPDIE